MNTSIANTKIFCKTPCEINFSGGKLSSDTGMLLFGEFVNKIDVLPSVSALMNENDSFLKIHKSADIFMQKVYQNVSGNFSDDYADKIAYDPSFTSILGKNRLASQPTISRFMQKANDTTEISINSLLKILRKKTYEIQPVTDVVFDIDTTILPTYGKQEDAEYIHHYGAVGYHPILCYDGNTRDLLAAELREGSKYCGKDADEFLKPLLDEFSTRYKSTSILVRGDSGFAMPELYELVEEYGQACYVIRLKDNNVLYRKIEDVENELINSSKQNPTEKVVVYGEFMYRASSWSKERRVVYKLTKKPENLFADRMFIVTNTSMTATDVVDTYCKRGNMENFIKECKNEFAFACTRSQTRRINKNRLLIAAFAYQLFNIFRRIFLPREWVKFCANEIRLRLFKIAGKIIQHGRKMVFKLCSFYAYEKEFLYTHKQICSCLT